MTRKDVVRMVEETINASDMMLNFGYIREDLEEVIPDADITAIIRYIILTRKETGNGLPKSKAHFYAYLDYKEILDRM